MLFRSIQRFMLVGAGIVMSCSIGNSAAQAADPVDWVSFGFASAAGADQSSQGGSVSANGRCVVYDSESEGLIDSFGSTTLIDNDNGVKDVFLYDRLTGKAERISVSSTGKAGNEDSSQPQVSGDCRYVVFRSVAANLTDNDKNDEGDIFLRDRLTKTTTLVSKPDTGLPNEQANDKSFSPAISDDGQYIAFATDATNFDNDDKNHAADVFRYHTTTGVITPVSVTPYALAPYGNGYSWDPKLSADGRYISFTSVADNLIPAGDERDTNRYADVFVRDMNRLKTTRVSLTERGTQAVAGGRYGAISADGSRVAFQSESADITAGDRNGTWDIFVRDIGSKATLRASKTVAGGDPDGRSINASISGNGRYVIFTSWADNIDPAKDTNKVNDVFVTDLDKSKTRLVALTPAAVAPTARSTTQSRDDRTETNERTKAVDYTGRFISFTALLDSPDDLTPSNSFDDDINGSQVYLRDLNVEPLLEKQ